MLTVVDPIEPTDEEAPGALPNGTRVRKVLFDRGDELPIGTLGTVRGSLLTPREVAEEWGAPFLYYVEWDGWAGTRFALRSSKVSKVEDAS